MSLNAPHSAWRREAVIGPCRLLLGDARAILPALDPRRPRPAA